MKIRLPLFQVSATIVLAANAYAAKPGACVNPVLRWEMKSDYVVDGVPYTSRIKDDRTGTASRPYIDGVDGVSANLFFCGSGDATLVLNGSTRKLTLDFGTNLAPTGPTITPVTGAIFLNVRNILFPAGDRSAEYDFTTWLGSQNIPAPKGADRRFRMMNRNTDHQGTTISADELALTNSPYETAKVQVFHCPPVPVATPSALCAGVTKETWFVYPDPTANGAFRNIGSLVELSKQGVLSSLGEFEMPFYFVISIK